MKEKLILFLMFFATVSVAQSVKNVDAKTFKDLLEKEKVVLIDLRTDEEIEKKGLIKNAMQIDFFGKDSEAQILKLDKNKTYLVYCAGGGRSSQCGELMEKNGFKKVVNLEKGFDDWKKKGFETVERKPAKKSD